MPQEACPLFRPFAHSLHVALFGKTDGVEGIRAIQTTMQATGVAMLRQVHGNRTIVVRRPLESTEDADGMLTDVPGLALAVRSADCQTFAVYAPEQHVFGVLHAGWRGLLSGAIRNFFAVLQHEWGIPPSATWVAAGPSLCQQCADFTDPLRELPGISTRFIRGRHVDLQGIADAQLQELGIPDTQRERHARCTRCHPEEYWTYRGGDRAEVLGGRVNVLVGVLRPSMASGNRFPA